MEKGITLMLSCRRISYPLPPHTHPSRDIQQVISKLRDLLNQLVMLSPLQYCVTLSPSTNLDTRQIPNMTYIALHPNLLLLQISHTVLPT